MIRFSRSLTLTLSTFIFLLTSNSAVAEKSYQYEASLFGAHSEQFASYYETSYGGYPRRDNKAKEYGALVTAYLEPVSLDSTLPYSRAAFYQRKTSLGLSYSELSWDSLDIVRGGRVLDTLDYEEYGVNALLAHDSVPLWLGLSYNRDSAVSFSFADGSGGAGEHSKGLGFNLGWFVTDMLSGYIEYEQSEGEGTWDFKKESFGLGLQSLFSSDQEAFYELDIGLKQIRTKRVSSPFSTGYFPTFSVSSFSIYPHLILPASDYSVSGTFAYYPSVKSRLALRIEHVIMEHENEDVTDFGIDGHYYVLDYLKLGFEASEGHSPEIVSREFRTFSVNVTILL